MVEMGFWQPNVGEDCIFVVAHCNGCRIKKTWFIAEPSPQPSDKPRTPLEGWSIDLITTMELVSLEGYCHRVVGIGCFTKWNEVWSI